MNKTEFIKELSKITNLTEDKCKIVNDILENTFIIGKDNKDKILNKIKEKLNLTEEQVNDIYNKAMSIITKELKNKIINPFKNIEK